MRRIFLTLPLLALLAGTVPAEEKEKPPAPAPPPALAIVSLDKEGRFVMPMIMPVNVPVQVQEPVTRNGKTEVITQTVYRTEFQQVVQKWDARNFHVYDTTGKEILFAQLPGLLANPTPVLISYQGPKMDPLYLKVVKEGTLILVPPKPAPGLPPEAPVPVPVPTEKPSKKSPGQP